MSRRCSAGLSRRIAFSRRSSAAAGRRGGARCSWYFSESRYSSLPGDDRRRSRSSRSRSRCRRSARAWRRARGAPRRPGGRRLQVLGEDVRACWRRSSAGSTSAVDVGQLADVLGQLPARVLPGEVGVGLAEAELRERRIIGPAGERLGEEDHVGVVARAPRRSATPRTASGLVCGLSTRKTRTPRSTQRATTSRSASQRPRQSSRVEVEVVDVLVALRRVLGVLERAVGAAVEPLRVLASARGGRREHWMAKSSAISIPTRPRAVDEAARSRASGAEARVDRVVAALARRRSPTGCRGRRGPRSSALLRPLRFGHADRVDRRQVDDVEAELGELRQLLAHARRSRPRSAGRARTRRRSARARARRRRRQRGRSPCPRSERARPRRERGSSALPRARASIAAQLGASPSQRRRPRASALGRPSSGAPRDLALELLSPAASLR